MLGPKSVTLDIPFICFQLDLSALRQPDPSSPLRQRKVDVQLNYFISVDPKIKWVPQRILDPLYQAVIKEIFTRIV